MKCRIMKNNVRKSDDVNLSPVTDDSDEIRKFIKQKELQNQVLKKIIEKIKDDKSKEK
jgi:hypothetical protein